MVTQSCVAMLPSVRSSVPAIPECDWGGAVAEVVTRRRTYFSWDAKVTMCPAGSRTMISRAP